MHGPRTALITRNKSVFTEVVRPERIVFRASFRPENLPRTVEFIAEGRTKTLLNWRNAFRKRVEEFEKGRQNFLRPMMVLKQNVRKSWSVMSHSRNRRNISQKRGKISRSSSNGNLKAPHRQSLAGDYRQGRDEENGISIFPKFKPEVGFRFLNLPAARVTEKQYRHLCEITEVIPEKTADLQLALYDGLCGQFVRDVRTVRSKKAGHRSAPDA